MKLTKEQIEGVEWIKKNLQTYKGVILADRCGLGKTAQAIELLKQSEQGLIICPAYLVFNWLDELEKWGYDKKICVIDSGKQLLYDAPLYLVSYNMSVAPGIFPQLFKKKFDLIVSDESHSLKAWNTKRSKYILGTYQNKKTNLLQRTTNILCMSGTPILNRVDELYNVIIRIAPEAIKFMGKPEFIQHFAERCWQTPWGLKHEGVKNEKQLQLLLKDVMLCRTKIEGLPERIDRYIKIDIKGAELKKFIAAENEFLQSHGITEADILGSQKLTQNDMSIIAEIRQKAALQKIPLLMSALEDITEKHSKIIIYAYHHSVIDALTTSMDKKGYKYKLITGKTPMAARNDIIKEYQEGDLSIIVATIGALREGVNLTKGEAVLFLELDWTPAYMEQTIARVWRRGQNKTVFVYYFYFTGGIDNYIMRMLKKKGEMIKKIL